MQRTTETEELFSDIFFEKVSPKVVEWIQNPEMDKKRYFLWIDVHNR